MEPTAKRIGIVPMGELPELIPKVIAAHVEAFLGIPADILPGEEIPAAAYDDRRLQFDAGVLISLLESRPSTGHLKTVAVVPGDLFVPIFTFVFGESRQGGPWAVTSVARLETRENGDDEAGLLYERVAKVTLHEMGHLFRLVHCDDPLCLMHFAGGVSDLDRTPMQFCRYCTVYLREGIGDEGGGRQASGGRFAPPER